MIRTGFATIALVALTLSLSAHADGERRHKMSPEMKACIEKSGVTLPDGPDGWKNLSAEQREALHNARKTCHQQLKGNKGGGDAKKGG